MKDYEKPSEKEVKTKSRPSTAFLDCYTTKIDSLNALGRVVFDINLAFELANAAHGLDLHESTCNWGMRINTSPKPAMSECGFTDTEFTQKYSDYRIVDVIDHANADVLRLVFLVEK